MQKSRLTLTIVDVLCSRLEKLDTPSTPNLATLLVTLPFFAMMQATLDSNASLVWKFPAASPRRSLMNTSYIWLWRIRSKNFFAFSDRRWDSTNERWSNLHPFNLKTIMPWFLFYFFLRNLCLIWINLSFTVPLCKVQASRQQRMTQGTAQRVERHYNLQ